MTISPEAKEAALSLALMFYSPDKPHKFEERAEKSIQLAINSATAPLQKEIERLRGEVGKAYREGFSAGLYASRISHITNAGAFAESRARRVAEGKE